MNVIALWHLVTVIAASTSTGFAAGSFQWRNADSLWWMMRSCISGLHSFRFQLDFSSSVHCVTQLNS